MQKNPVALARPARPVLAAGLCLATVTLALAGCASADPVPGTGTTARAPIYERSDNQTGSNLPKKANKPSNVLVVDPEAVQGAARGATRNSGTGP